MVREATEARLPTGTITFLFSDIEGSTKLLNRLGDRFTEVLETHQALIRDAFADHHGIEVSTEGDAFFAVFTSPVDAVLAAADAQKALAGHDWGEDVVKVRIGLHTGLGTLGGDNYSGIDVNRAARIMSTGHGGQVVMSDATAALVERNLTNGLSVSSLGFHRLKDLDHPEHIHQLTIEGLQNEFPPPRSLDARPNNLPAHLSTFIDRPEQLAAVRDYIRERRHVTLTGPGGTGKTRLALEIASDLLVSFRDGVFIVRLATVMDDSLVASMIATELGLKEEGTRSVLDQLKEHLSDKEMLLVLDNYEQVIDAAPLVPDLLSSGPKLKVMVTSRAPLRVTGEQEYPVPPMSLPDPSNLPPVDALEDYEAIALFVERARSAKPDFALSEQNAETIARICTRVDGLPLAIELAAARVRILSPADLYARLDSCLVLLSGGRDLTERQRTLRGAIQWSYDLLSEPERCFFRRLGVFAGSWTFAEAEAVCDPMSLGIDVLDGLETLADNSLVRRFETDRGETRFRMLQTIREFALDRLLAADELDDLTVRHANYFAEAAPERLAEMQVAIPSPEEALLDDDNYRAALTYFLECDDIVPGLDMAGTIWRYWQIVGHLAEGRQWLERYLDHPTAQDAGPARIRALSAIGSITYWQSDFAATRHYYELALDALIDSDDRAGLAEAYYNLGFLLTVEERYEEGLEAHMKSRAIYEELGDERGIATTALGLGINRVLVGEYETSNAYADEAFAFFDPHNEWLGLMMSGFIRYQALRFTAQYDEGAKVMVEMFDRIGEELDPASLSSLFDTLADVSAGRGRLDVGLILSAAAQRIKDEVGGAAPPTLIRPVDIRALAAETLTQEQIDALWAEGMSLSPQEAIALARKQID